MTNVQKAVIKAKGIEELAEMLSVDFSTVWRWYVGKTKPSRMATKLILEYLGKGQKSPKTPV